LSSTKRARSRKGASVAGAAAAVAIAAVAVAAAAWTTGISVADGEKSRGGDLGSGL
jgi:hypothetical protein